MKEFFIADDGIRLHAKLAAGMRPDDCKAVMPLSPALVIPDCARKGRMSEFVFDPGHIPDSLTHVIREFLPAQIGG